MSALTESSWATLGQVGRLDKDSFLLKCKASKLAYKGVGTGMHMAPSEPPVCFTQHAYLPQS
jgi:hypothetical protein